MPSVKIESAAGAVRGFKYLWMKRVTGFDPSQHCARCLRGEYSKAFSPAMAVNVAHPLAYRDGDLLYFCGVSVPFVWRNNLHFVGRVSDHAGEVRTPLFTGDVLVTHGLEPVPFDDSVARADFPNLPAAFLTCRNFQFGAFHFHAGR